ncbi:MAG: YdcF family protein [Clostridia bacterium]|nr:YdcF family protein [Clostridia bacterium]
MKKIHRISGRWMSFAAAVLFLFQLSLFIHLEAAGETYEIREADREYFECLLTDLLSAYEEHEGAALSAISNDLEMIRMESSQDYEIAEAIASHWKQVYLSEYPLIMATDPDAASMLEAKGVKDSQRHAFVVLGYALKAGEMTDELKGRCEAAAVGARAFPNAWIVCSGGATGGQNPEQHTEAGLMRAYLSEQCGIDPARILIDEEALTTAENALYTFRILREQQVETITIVTSAYHQKWGQVIYNAVSALYRQECGYSAEIMGNLCYEADGKTMDRDAGIAIRQLASILKIKLH